ncbi:GTPase, partial [Planctomycetota bacterium]
AKEESGRGYDFVGVVRWLAERADVVIVFFDPDKPGTTGETLQVFTQSLRGIDHKLLIVMNKMDLFRSLQDFSRCYGALCWNLGKVIPRKDLPHIFTTFVPVQSALTPVLPTEDFVKAREELICAVQQAPARRLDNMLTQLEEYTERLRLHATAADRAARDLFWFRVKMVGIQVLVGLLCMFVVLVAVQFGLGFWFVGLAVCVAAGALCGGHLFVRSLVRAAERQLIASLSVLFERMHARELLVRGRADDLLARWAVVEPRAKETLRRLGLRSFSRLRSGEAARLAHVVDSEIPSLRARLHRHMQAR